MRIVFAAALLWLPLAGCTPTLEMRDGEHRERLLEVARRFCAAERSPDPHDTRALFVAGYDGMLQRLPGRFAEGERAHLTSGDPAAACEPGRTWFRGSRAWAEVRLAERSDRLYFFDGEWPRIRDVIYGRPRQVAGRKFKSLGELLFAETAADRAKAAPLLPPPPPPPQLACYPGNYRFAFVGTDTEVYRQGATVKVTPMVDRAPAGTDEIPSSCVTGWSVSGPATLSSDGKSITIAPDAPPGSIVTVSFRHADKDITRRLRVVGRDEVVLTGRYSQRSIAGCQASEPVRELEFMPESGFSVTFSPFETYRDYWGTYVFNPATGQLRLTVEGGNFVPEGLDLEGEARLSSGSLTLEGLFLGSRNGPPQQDCTYSF